jgi:hypothetical protein
MNREEVFARWAPEGAPWSAWVKPVLFAYVGDEAELPARPRLAPEALMLPAPADPYRAPAPRPRDLAVVVDLPGIASVGAGLALAGFGFQPVPLYNSLPMPNEFSRVYEQVAVDVWPVVRALAGAAPSLPSPDAGAPPAFLLDSARLASEHELRWRVFDNRSFSNGSDFPSGGRLQQAGIRRALVWGTPRWDVALTLRHWQQEGLPIFSTDGSDAEPLKISFWAPLRHWFESQAFHEGPGTS